MPELELIAKQSQAAVIAITESWLDGSYTDASVGIEGYNIIRRDRVGHAGGFVPILEMIWLTILG